MLYAIFALSNKTTRCAYSTVSLSVTHYYTFRMKNIIRTIALLLCATNIQAEVNTAILDSLGNHLLKSSNTNGAYVSIQKNGSVIYSKAFGYRNKALKQPFDAETVFPISSNTKAFAATMLLQLDEQGLIDISQPVINYVPDIEFSDPYLTSNATTIDLLTHRCGLPRYDFTYITIDPERTQNANEILFHKLKYMKLYPGFRTQFGYGNIQYIIGAHIYEAIAQEKWETGLSKHILEPLSMTGSHCDYKRFKQTENRSQGYINGEKTDVAYDAGIYTISGAGNMFSTINDLEQWTHFLLHGNDSILSKLYLDFALTPQFSIGYEEPFDGFSSISYGLGWFIFDYWGHKVVLHFGDNAGHQTIIVLLPDDAISWTIVANNASQKAGFPFWMTFSLLDMFANDTLNNWVERFPVDNSENIRYPDSLSDRSVQPTLPIKTYCGEYVNEGLGSITIVERNNSLYAEIGRLTAEITHWKGDSFRMYLKKYNEDHIINFIVDETNKVAALTTDMVEPSMGMEKFDKKR